MSKTKGSWEPIINIFDPDINYGDVYLLNYYGVLVFFSVCWVGAESVRVVELASYSYKNGKMLYSDMRLSKKPYFVRKNVRTKSDYEIMLNEECERGVLPIYVPYGCRLYCDVLSKRVDIPTTGLFFAEKVSDYRNIYFISSVEEKSIDA